MLSVRTRLPLCALALVAAVAPAASASRVLPAPSGISPGPSPSKPSDASVSSRATALMVRPKQTNPLRVALTPATQGLRLSATRDYVVTIPQGTVFTHPVTIAGGHNVILENSVLQYVRPVGASPSWTVRGLYLTDQTGVMWVKGLQVRGPLSEGIDLSQKQPHAAVVLLDVALDTVTGSVSTNHADLLQTWAGPDRLVVSNFEGSSTYQGMFLKPRDAWAEGPPPSFFSLRDVRLDVSTGHYALWTEGYDAFPVEVRDVVVRPNPTRPSRDAWLWPKPSTGDTTWRAVQSAA